VSVDKISIDFINEVLFEYEFKRVDFITEPGFSVRWGIVDVFSFSNDNPYRIELERVDSIRSFDVGTQLSIEIQKIIPNVENKIFRRTESFLDYISENSNFYPKYGGFYRN
jgi:transcription-repair coupling factor (superfamily II helicase)